MATRRGFLGGAAAISASVIADRWLGITRASATSLATLPGEFDYSKLRPFVDPLPIPRILKATSRIGGLAYYEVAMSQFRQRLHVDLPGPTTLWGYNGTYPGPTIEARTNRPVQVKWINNLPDAHLLPVDHDIVESPASLPDSRTVVHLHGAHAGPESDGYPDAWFTRAFARTGPDFQTRTYFYPNDQQAATLWYHDHAAGVTRLNVYAGLAGFYIVRDDFEDSLRLPSGDFEVPLVVQDRSLDTAGQLLYPAQWSGFFRGEAILVNGKIWPRMRVQPRKYRFRMLNGSNQRNFAFQLRVRNADGSLAGAPEHLFNQIGTDGGLLPAPVSLATIPLSPAERADVVIDFSNYRGRRLVLTIDNGTASAMLFEVDPHPSGPDASPLPSTLRPITRLDPGSIARPPRVMGIGFGANGEILLNGKLFTDAVQENPKRGTTEIWDLSGLSGHPIHLHLVQFQILKLGGATPTPDQASYGWKDTVAVQGQTQIIARFDGTPGRYVWHCHMLEHEDNDMMRPYNLIA